jgi:hypothetical protein
VTSRTRGGNEVRKTKASTTNAGKKLLKKIKKIAKELMPYIFSELPDLEEAYKSIPKKYRPFGIFSTVMVNGDSPKIIHKDGKDLENGICCVVPFGEYKEGNLKFPLYGSEFALKKGIYL